MHNKLNDMEVKKKCDFKKNKQIPHCLFMILLKSLMNVSASGLILITFCKISEDHAAC